MSTNRGRLYNSFLCCRTFGSRSMLLQNSCFALAHLGAGITIYNKISNHKQISCSKRVLIASTGSVTFNYGTVLILANIKLHLPESQLLRCTVGLGVLGFMFWMGSESLDLCKWKLIRLNHRFSDFCRAGLDLVKKTFLMLYILCYCLHVVVCCH